MKTDTWFEFQCFNVDLNSWLDAGIYPPCVGPNGPEDAWVSHLVYLNCYSGLKYRLIRKTRTTTEEIIDV